ncbi:hypothetical protein ACFWPQ_50695 [Streptomyces sp. NPDC058464]
MDHAEAVQSAGVMASAQSGWEQESPHRAVDQAYTASALPLSDPPLII